jgi:hypothetical protein
VKTAASSAPGTDTREADYSLGGDSPAAKLIQSCIVDAQSNHARKDRDRQDWKNLLFDRGGDAQWVIWDRGTDRYVERGYDPERGGLPEWIPRSSTNLFSNKIDGVAQILNQSDPAKEFAPSTTDDEDLATAEVAEQAVPVLLEEISYNDDLKPRANKLVCLIDKVFFVPYYDADPKYGTDVIPDMRCLDCKVQVPPSEGTDEEGNALPCPGCGQPLEVAVGPRGELLGEAHPIGKLCCELIPSFEASLPKAARVADARRVPWVLFHTRMSVSEIERRWPKAKALELSARGRGAAPGPSSGLSRHFADAMTMLSSPRRAQEGKGGEAHPDPVVYRLQHDPVVTDDVSFPEGLYAVMVDDQLLEAGPLPVADDKGRPVKSVVIRQYDAQPGTAFGKPPADDLVPLQEDRNTVQSLIMMILMHDAAPRTFIPLGVSLESEITGIPGEHIYYRPGPGGEKPTTEFGINPPEGLYKQLELIDQKFDEISKLNAVLQGATPEGGDKTLGEIQILQERGMAAFKGPLDQQVKAERQLVRLLLWIARDSAWSPRFRQVMGESGEWELQQFVGAELGGSIDVLVETTSAWPKSPLMQRMMIREAIEVGALPPAAQDPELAQKLLSLFNLAELKPSLDLDRKQIARKLDRWKAAQMPQEILPPRPDRENLPLHFLHLTNFLKSEPFELLETQNPAVAQAMVMHVQQISAMLAQQAAAAAAAQQPQKPDTRTAREKGDDSALKGAVESGAIVPAGAVPPPPDPMQALTAAGAIVPAGAQAPQGRSLDELLEARALTPLAGMEAQGPM